MAYSKVVTQFAVTLSTNVLQDYATARQSLATNRYVDSTPPSLLVMATEPRPWKDRDVTLHRTVMGLRSGFAA